jgi:phospholipid/cholesterol/gamma-HCH transport system substrate-binding protein
MKRANESLVGAVVLAAFAILVAGSIWLSQMRVGGTDQIASARFRSIGGLKKGSFVMLRGVRIGRVTAVALGEQNWVNVELTIGAEYEVPQRPAAIISSTTLFGDWAVDIVTDENLPNDPEVVRQIAEARRAGGDRWPGATLPDIGELTAQAGRIAGDLALIADRVEDAFDSTSARRLRGAFLDLSNLSRRLSQIATRQQEAMIRIGDNLDTGTASLARTARALERTVSRADSATSREQLTRILSHTDSITDDLRVVAANLRGFTGAAAAQQDALTRIIANTDSVLLRANAGEGTIGKLSRDTTLYSESVQAVRSLRQMLDDMRANPRRYFSFSVF